MLTKLVPSVSAVRGYAKTVQSLKPLFDHVTIGTKAKKGIMFSEKAAGKVLESTVVSVGPGFRAESGHIAITPFHTSQILLAAHQPFTMKTVRERILLVLSLYDKIDADKLTLDSNFSTDLGLDSLDFVEVIMAIEDEFQFEIPDGDMDRLKTPRDIYQYVCDKEDVYD